jgi:hypothetical protein
MLLADSLPTQGVMGSFPVRSFLAFLAGTLILGAFTPNGVEEQNESRVAIFPREHVAGHKEPRSPGALRVDVKAVLIPVTATNMLGRPVTDLRVDDFDLFEDNVKQKIAFVTTEEAPISLGVIFDSSGSMASKMDTSVSAVEQFFKMSMPGDECLLVRFSDRPYLIGAALQCAIRQGIIRFCFHLVICGLANHPGTSMISFVKRGDEGPPQISLLTDSSPSCSRRSRPSRG